MSDTFAIPVSSDAMRAESLEEMAAKVAAATERLKPLEECEAEEARRIRQEKGNPFAPGACDLAGIENIEIASRSGPLKARVYTPLGSEEGPHPLLIFYHGGGFVLGSVDQYDTVTQQLAFHSGCKVISVEYRLAPDTKSTGIYEDGFDAYRWVRENAAELNVDVQRIALGGDSAGGNLTISVLLTCKAESYPMPAYQLLIYPATDWAMTMPSIDEFAEGYFLSKKGMEWFRSQYLENPEQVGDPTISPLNADLTGMPSAYVLTAGFDPLRDEGKAFADRLAEFGVTVEHECYTDMIHGFISFAGGIAAGMHALKEMGRRLQKALAVEAR